MKTVNFQTDDDALFQFAKKDVEEHLKFLAAERNIDRLTKLLEFISSSKEETIFIPEEHHYFGFVALDLISQGKGSVTCKPCNQTYPSQALNPITIGHGKSPFNLNFKKPGGLKSLFRMRQKLPGLFGGKGYVCPEGHELISMITWRR